MFIAIQHTHFDMHELKYNPNLGFELGGLGILFAFGRIKFGSKDKSSSTNPLKIHFGRLSLGHDDTLPTSLNPPPKTLVFFLSHRPNIFGLPCPAKCCIPLGT
jgi:hypothetical protein